MFLLAGLLKKATWNGHGLLWTEGEKLEIIGTTVK
jgi:hypothetical protein